MPIMVLSPFSGKPVKVRDQDAGRAVKDEEGRLFYVLPRSDGGGYYGATTRAGNPKEETRAMELEAKVARSQGNAKEQVEISLNAVQVKQSNSGKIIFVVIVLILGGVFYAAFWGPLMQYNPWASVLNSSASTPKPAAPAPTPAP